MKYTEALQMRKRAGWLSDPGWHAGIVAGHGLAKLFGGKAKEGDIYENWDSYSASPGAIYSQLALANGLGLGTAIAGVYGLDKLLARNKWLNKHNILRKILAGSAGIGLGRYIGRNADLFTVAANHIPRSQYIYGNKPAQETVK